MVKQTKRQRFMRLCERYDLHIPQTKCLDIPEGEKEMIKLIQDLKKLIFEIRNLYYTQ